MQKIRNLFGGLITVLASLALVPSVSAAPSYSLFGEATLVNPGNSSDTAVQMVSDADPGYGSVEFQFPSGLTFAQLTKLSTDFNVTDDNCGGGSPRFSVKVDQAGTEKNIFVYLGDAPNYNTCTPNTWVNSGDLLETGKTVDTSQLGGSFYQSYDDAVAAFGSLTVTKISLVTDAGWSQVDGEQTILADNVMINEALVDFEPVMPVSKDECKKGGWQTFGVFKNQGDCVSFVATKSRNQPALNQ